MTSMLTKSDSTKQVSTTQRGAGVESSQPAQAMPMSAEVAPRERSGGGKPGDDCCGSLVGHVGVELRPCVCNTHGDGCLGSLACCILLPLVCLTGAILVRFYECSNFKFN
jgi:hypothetical protein